MKPASRIISILMLVHVQGGHRDLLLLDVTSMSLGVKLFDGSMEVLIPRCVHVLVFFVCLFCLLCACVFCVLVLFVVCLCFLRVCLFCMFVCVLARLCCYVLVLVCLWCACVFVRACGMFVCVLVHFHLLLCTPVRLRGSMEVLIPRCGLPAFTFLKLTHTEFFYLLKPICCYHVRYLPNNQSGYYCGSCCAYVIHDRNTPVPAKRSKVFTTVDDFTTSLPVEIYQGEFFHASQNRLLGKFSLVCAWCVSECVCLCGFCACACMCIYIRVHAMCLQQSRRVFPRLTEPPAGHILTGMRLPCASVHVYMRMCVCACVCTCACACALMRMRKLCS